jgi:acyl-CoA synthetase (NDP forming)
MHSGVIEESAIRSRFDELVEIASSENRSVLLEHEAYEVVRSLGIAVPETIFISADENPIVAAENAWESLWGSRVVVKAVSPEIVHKTDLGAVKIVEKLPATISNTIEEMRSRLKGFDVRGFLVSRHVDHDPSPGGELLVNVRWTAEFGPVVSIGLGGVSAEFLGKNLRPGTEIAVFAPGLVSRDRLAAILEEKAFTPLLTGSLRGKAPRLELKALRDLVMRLLDTAATRFPLWFEELEINPLVVGPRGVTALDAFVRIGGHVPASIPRPLDKIRNLLEPRSIAVVGVSRSMNPGRIIVRNLIREGFDPNRIWIVKKGCAEIDGCACVGSIEDLPEPVDLIVLSIGAEAIPGAMESIVASRKAESVIVIPGGLGESEGTRDLEGAIRSLIESSRRTEWRGPVVNGGNSLGIRSAQGNYDTTFLPHHKVAAASRPGDAITLVSQSGAFAASLAGRLAPISPRTIVSIGNQIDLTVGDYMSALADDPSIDLFAFYVEGFRSGDGRQWLEAAKRAIDAGKAVILYRAGRTAEGMRSTASHTAAMAGDAVVSRELARGCGVVVADSLDEFEDLIRTFWLLRERSAAGLRLGAVSNAGFECVAMADNPGCFRFVPFSDATADRIGLLLRQNRLETIMNVRNPLDVNPLMPDEAFADSVRAVLADPGIDLGVVGCVPLTGALQTLPLGHGHEEELSSEGAIGTRLAELWRLTDKPWVAVVDGGAIYDPLAQYLLGSGIPTFRRADRAIRILSAWAERAVGSRR